MSAKNIVMAAAGASGPATYIEDVFSTYLYTGNGSSQTITNGIDLAGKGGLFWVKARAVAGSHGLMYGSGTELCSHSTNGLPASQPYTFGSSGITFTGGVWSGFSSPNESGRIYTSWTFRKQPKFFDVVTYTGNGVAGRTVAHNLGSVPGCIIVKCTSTAGTDWEVYHRGIDATAPQNYQIYLNATNARQAASNRWNNTAPTATDFTVGAISNVNGNGQTYVAYLFAHNAGGFGAAGTDNVISCGSFTGTGSPVEINLGWEPQWILIKPSSVSATNWRIHDNMRGMPVGNTSNILYPNLSDAETAETQINVTPTGFLPNSYASNGVTYIYIAIRRGPMKTPTSGTSVFGALSRTGTSADATLTAGFPVDATLIKSRSTSYRYSFSNRLIGAGYDLDTSATSSEYSTSTIGVTGYDSNTGIRIGSGNTWNDSTQTFINWFFRRAPGFMDVVSYTGNGSVRTISHNLGVAPELMIVKRRNSTNPWSIYAAPVGAGKVTFFDTAAPINGVNYWNNTAPTSSVFSLGIASDTNTSGGTFIAYLFASCPGVSKVGSFTQVVSVNTQVNCGFTSGARFVMLRRYSSTGAWYVLDTTRGIIVGNDPYLQLNVINTEVTSSDVLVPYAQGFQINGNFLDPGDYIYLAIA